MRSASSQRVHMTTSPLEARLEQIFRDPDERSRELRLKLTTPNDLVGVVLRGHLVVEELLSASCGAYCKHPEHLHAARLRFPQLVLLLRALEKLPAVPSQFWDALLELNAIRNALAHRLELKNLEGKIDRFVDLVGVYKVENPLPAPTSRREALENAIAFLVGGFEVIATFHKNVDELLELRDAQGSAGIGA
jgi:hypothetical protein